MAVNRSRLDVPLGGSNRSVRVLTLIDSLSGGAGLVAASIVRNTSRYKHSIAYIPSLPSYHYGVTPVSLEALAEIVPLSERSVERQSWELSNLIARTRPDVILHHWWKDCALEDVVIKSGIRGRTPTVHISHNNDPSPPGYAYYVSVSKFNSTFQNKNLRVDANGMALNHTVICNASPMEMPGLSERRFNGGVSLRIGSLQHFKLKPDWFDFVDTIRAPHKLHLLVGDGPLLKHFSAQAAEKDRSCKFIVSPGVAHGSEDFRMILGSADVFLIESVKPEAGPLAVLDALSAGIPVIADRNGALPEYVDDGINGFLVNSREEMAATCERLLLDINLWRTISAQAIESSRLFSAHDQALRYETVITRLVEASRRDDTF